MANPQLENGYIRISTEIWEALTKIRIPGEAMNVFMAIIRKTYGWNKKEDRIALSQLSEMSGLKKPNVLRAIHKLESMNLISVIKKDNDYIPNYCFNKNYEKWKPLSKKITTVIKKDNSVIKLATTINTKSINTITKDNIYKQLFDWFWQNYKFRDNKKIGKSQTISYLKKYVKESEFEDFKKATLKYCSSENYTKDPFRFINNRDWNWKDWINYEKPIDENVNPKEKIYDVDVNYVTQCPRCGCSVQHELDHWPNGRLKKCNACNYEPNKSNILKSKNDIDEDWGLPSWKK